MRLILLLNVLLILPFVARGFTYLGSTQYYVEIPPAVPELAPFRLIHGPVQCIQFNVTPFVAASSPVVLTAVSARIDGGCALYCALDSSALDSPEEWLVETPVAQEGQLVTTNFTRFLDLEASIGHNVYCCISIEPADWGSGLDWYLLLTSASVQVTDHQSSPDDDVGVQIAFPSIASDSNCPKATLSITLTARDLSSTHWAMAVSHADAVRIESDPPIVTSEHLCQYTNEPAPATPLYRASGMPPNVTIMIDKEGCGYAKVIIRRMSAGVINSGLLTTTPDYGGPDPLLLEFVAVDFPIPDYILEADKVSLLVERPDMETSEQDPRNTQYITTVASEDTETTINSSVQCYSLPAGAASIRVYSWRAVAVAMVPLSEEDCALIQVIRDQGDAQASALLVDTAEFTAALVSSFTPQNSEESKHNASELRSFIASSGVFIGCIAFLVVILLGTCVPSLKSALLLLDVLFSDDHAVAEGTSPVTQRTLFGAALSSLVLVVLIAVCGSIVAYSFEFRFQVQSEVMPSSASDVLNVSLTATVHGPISYLAENTTKVLTRPSGVTISSVFEQKETFFLDSQTHCVQILGTHIQILEPTNTQPLSAPFSLKSSGLFSMSLALSTDSLTYSLFVPRVTAGTENCNIRLSLGLQIGSSTWIYPPGYEGPERTIAATPMQVDALCDSSEGGLHLFLQQSNYLVQNTVVDNLELVPLLTMLGGAVGGLISVSTIIFKALERVGKKLGLLKSPHRVRGQTGPDLTMSLPSVDQELEAISFVTNPSRLA